MSEEENSIVLNFKNTLLRTSDINILRGPHWLNDQIISFYMEYLENIVYKDNRDMLFVSPEVVQCIKLVSKEEIDIFLSPLNAKEKQYLFFPLNDNDEDRVGGTHWSLLVFSRPEQTFFHFDSLQSNNLRHCYNFARNLAHGVGCLEFDFLSSKCLQQSNGYDCGIHVLCNVDWIARQCVEQGRVELQEEQALPGAFNVTSTSINSKRNKLLNIISDLNTIQNEF